MSAVDVFLDGLGDEARVAMRALVAKAYERGFREGLSTAGLSEDELLRRSEVALSAPATERPPPPDLTTGAPIAVPAPQAGTEGAVAMQWDEAELDGELDEAPEAEAPRPIMVHATVGTLMRRIERTFALERFDIDVVVCRRGDREKRQLKSSVRLKNYVRER